MERTLYSYWRSSASYRVRIALALKRLDYGTSPVDLLADAQGGVGFALLNPQGMVPYLIDGSAGLNQSLAIIEYLDETYPDPPLLPGDALARARIRGVALTIACDIHPLNNLRVLNYLKGPLGVEPETANVWARHWIETGLCSLEEIAAASTGRYLCGDAITLADVCLVPQLYNARRFRAALDRCPALTAIDRKLHEHPAFAAARPERQPDAVEDLTLAKRAAIFS